MIYLFYFPHEDSYVYTTEEWFSSNFDSIEQLADVGLDDYDKVRLNDPAHYEYPLTPRLDHSEFYTDAIYLGTYTTFEELTIENYPELWV